MGFSLWIEVGTIILTVIVKVGTVLSLGQWVVISFYSYPFFLSSPNFFFLKYIVNQTKKFQSMP